MPTWFTILMEAVTAAPTIAEGAAKIEAELTSGDNIAEKAAVVVQQSETVLNALLANTVAAPTAPAAS